MIGCIKTLSICNNLPGRRIGGLFLLISYKINIQIVGYCWVDGIYFTGGFIFNSYKVMVFEEGGMKVFVDVLAEQV